MTIKRIAQELISQTINQDSPMTFLTGPRQVGKTFLANTLSPHFYNWDTPEVKKQFLKDPYFFRRNYSDSSLIIFDEIHKRRDWKKLLKGYYDSLIAQKISLSLVQDDLILLGKVETLFRDAIISTIYFLSLLMRSGRSNSLLLYLEIFLAGLLKQPTKQMSHSFALVASLLHFFQHPNPLCENGMINTSRD